MGCDVAFNPHAQIQHFRDQIRAELTDPRIEKTPNPPGFTNPTQDDPVQAARFLSHLDLDHPLVNEILRDNWRYYDRRTMGPKLRARFRWLVWSILRGYPNPHRARNALLADQHAQRSLDFTDGVPGYDTMNEFWKWATNPVNAHRLIDAFVKMLHRHLEDLGTDQVEDAVPYRSLRDDDSAPYNGHYKCQMHKVEARWCTRHDALLVGALSWGTSNEVAWSPPLTRRVKRLGLTVKRLTIDRAYPSYAAIATHALDNVHLGYHACKHWNVDTEHALEEVDKRYNEHWQHEAYVPSAPSSRKARFLIEHGTDEDQEKGAKWIRDHYLETRDEEEAARVSRERARNEAYHPDLHRVLLEPDRRGMGRMIRLCMAALLSLHAIQLCRAQNGLTTGLSSTGSIL